MLGLRWFDNLIAYIFIILTSNAFVQVLTSDVNDFGKYEENSLLISILIIFYGIIAIRLFTRLDVLVQLVTKTKIMVLLISFPLFTSFFTNDPYFTFQKSLALNLTLLSCYYFYIFFSLTSFMKLFLNSLYFMLICSLLLGLIFPDNFIHSFGTHQGLLHGVFPQKQVLGQISSLSLILSLLYRDLMSKNRFSLQITVTLCCLFWSGSVTALLISSFIVFFVYFEEFTKKINANSMRVLYAFAIFIFFIVGYILYLNIEGFLLSMGKDITFSGRTYLWDYVIHDAETNFYIGSGYKSFWNINADLIFLYFDYFAVNGHNFLLDYYLEQGLFGLLLFVFFIFDYISSALKFSKGNLYYKVQISLVLYLFLFGIVATIFPNQNSVFTILILFFYIISKKGPKHVAK